MIPPCHSVYRVPHHPVPVADWWQAADSELFSAKTATMAKQAEEWTFVDVEDGGKVHSGHVRY